MRFLFLFCLDGLVRVLQRHFVVIGSLMHRLLFDMATCALYMLLLRFLFRGFLDMLVKRLGGGKRECSALFGINCNT
jgi:hypothetical protein